MNRRLPIRVLTPTLACLTLAGCSIPADADTAPMEKPTMTSSPPLIPRQILFGNPDKAALRVSPDGRHIAFLAPVNGVLNVWVAPADTPQVAKPVTQDTVRGIRRYFWAYTNSHILYLQDQGATRTGRSTRSIWAPTPPGISPPSKRSPDPTGNRSCFPMAHPCARPLRLKT